MRQAADIVRRWVELYSDGTPDTYGSDRFLELYTPNVDWVEMPSPMHPSGRSGDAETIRKGLKQNNKLFRNRRVELNEVIEQGNIAAWTAIWSATVAEDNPEDGIPVKAGSRIQIRMAAITEVVDGLIVRQHEYISNPEIIKWDAL
jgi:ketosteroid isomerase-like protein